MRRRGGSTTETSPKSGMVTTMHPKGYQMTPEPDDGAEKQTKRVRQSKNGLETSSSTGQRIGSRKRGATDASKANVPDHNTVESAEREPPRKASRRSATTNARSVKSTAKASKSGCHSSDDNENDKDWSGSGGDNTAKRDRGEKLSEVKVGAKVNGPDEAGEKKRKHSYGVKATDEEMALVQLTPDAELQNMPDNLPHVIWAAKELYQFTLPTKNERICRFGDCRQLFGIEKVKLNNFRRHYKIKHAIPDTVRCTTCKQNYSTCAELERHHKQMKDKGRSCSSFCYLCGHEFLFPPAYHESHHAEGQLHRYLFEYVYGFTVQILNGKGVHCLVPECDHVFADENPMHHYAAHQLFPEGMFFCEKHDNEEVGCMANAKASAHKECSWKCSVCTDQPLMITKEAMAREKLLQEHKFKLIQHAANVLLENNKGRDLIKSELGGDKMKWSFGAKNAAKQASLSTSTAGKAIDGDGMRTQGATSTSGRNQNTSTILPKYRKFKHYVVPPQVIEPADDFQPEEEFDNAKKSVRVVYSSGGKPAQKPNTAKITEKNRSILSAPKQAGANKVPQMKRTLLDAATKKMKDITELTSADSSLQQLVVESSKTGYAERHSTAVSTRSAGGRGVWQPEADFLHFQSGEKKLISFVVQRPSDLSLDETLSPISLPHLAQAREMLFRSRNKAGQLSCGTCYNTTWDEDVSDDNIRKHLVDDHSLSILEIGENAFSTVEEIENYLRNSEFESAACTICNLDFEDVDDVTEHVTEKSHIESVDMLLVERLNAGKNMTPLLCYHPDCDCDVIKSLSAHWLERHSYLPYECLDHGSRFAEVTEVEIHTRRNKCRLTCLACSVDLNPRDCASHDDSKHHKRTFADHRFLISRAPYMKKFNKFFNTVKTDQYYNELRTVAAEILALRTTDETHDQREGSESPPVADKNPVVKSRPTRRVYGVDVSPYSYDTKQDHKGSALETDEDEAEHHGPSDEDEGDSENTHFFYGLYL